MTWRERRKLSYLMNKFNDWNLPCKTLPMSDAEIIETVLRFFETESSLVYPAKSYFVAIVYAKCLERYFGVNFFEALSYDDLLINDRCYVPYHDNKNTYDIILLGLNDVDILEMGSTQKTIKYFKEEFLIIDGTNN